VPKEHSHVQNYLSSHSLRPCTHETIKDECLAHWTGLMLVINARRMHTGVTIVCLFVCVSVCLLRVYCLLKTFMQHTMKSVFLPNSESLQLRNFTIKLSFTRYKFILCFLLLGCVNKSIVTLYSGTTLCQYFARLEHLATLQVLCLALLLL
jgi:hypothetical protein